MTWSEIMVSPTPMLNIWHLGSTSGTCGMKVCKSQVIRSVTKIFSSSSAVKIWLCFCHNVASLFKAIGIASSRMRGMSSLTACPGASKRCCPITGTNTRLFPGSLGVPQWGFVKSQLRKIMECKDFPKNLTGKEKAAWNRFAAEVRALLGNHKAVTMWSWLRL